MNITHLKKTKKQKPKTPHFQFGLLETTPIGLVAI